MKDKKIAAYFITAMLALGVGGGVGSQFSGDKHEQGQSKRAKKIDAAIIQLAKTQNTIMASVARLEYLTKQLADNDAVGQAIQDADKAWTEKVSMLSQQAQLIKQQQDEIAKLKAKLKQPKQPKDEKAKDKKPGDKS